MTTPEHKSNIARVSQALLTKKFKTDFCMGSYAYSDKCGPVKPLEIKNDCNTGACFLGHFPLVLGHTTSENYWSAYCHEVTGLYESSSDWCFLFGPNWPSSKEQAAARAFAYLSNSSEYQQWLVAVFADYNYKFPVPKPKDLKPWILDTPNKA